MEEQLISIETAKLAKEKGFDVETRDFLQYRSYRDGYKPFDNSDPLIRCYPEKGDLYRPTQSLLAKWLREKHNIIVLVFTNNPYKFSIRHKFIEGVTYKENDFSVYYDIEYYNTYEEALEAGLLQALKLI